MPDIAYQTFRRVGERLPHRYGPQVHILADVLSLSLLARLGHPETTTDELHRLLETAYQHLSDALVEQLVHAAAIVPTRMSCTDHTIAFSGVILEREQPLVIVDVARAGTLPSHWLQQRLFQLINPALIRVDHVFVNRVADPNTGHVTGVAFHGSKIGGSVDGVTLILPDPMGATGKTLIAVLEYYRKHAGGTPRRILTAHLMITPEYIRQMHHAFPEVEIYALRLDRGLSSEEVLRCMPGERFDEERGLNDHDYIVPGAGGLGELINNTVA